MRSLVTLSSGGHFSGILTGGNGRQPDLGQSAYYQFDVPATAKTLLADLALADGQTDPVIAYLVDPAGQTVSMATNELVTRFAASGPVETPTSRGGGRHHLSGPGTVDIHFEFHAHRHRQRLVGALQRNGDTGLRSGRAGQLPDSGTPP